MNKPQGRKREIFKNDDNKRMLDTELILSTDFPQQGEDGLLQGRLCFTLGLCQAEELYSIHEF